LERKVERMGSNNCFEILAVSVHDVEMVLQVDPVDKYAPRTTGVYNVHLHSWLKDKPFNDPERALQLWYYNAKRKALLSRKYPSKGLFEGFNRNLIVYKYRGLKNQVWSYDTNHHIWFNDFSHHALAVEKGSVDESNPAHGGNVITEAATWTNPREVFKVIPCK
jgi:hypothetical protein